MTLLDAIAFGSVVAVVVTVVAAAWYMLERPKDNDQNGGW